MGSFAFNLSFLFYRIRTENSREKQGQKWGRNTFSDGIFRENSQTAPESWREPFAFGKDGGDRSRHNADGGSRIHREHHTTKKNGLQEENVNLSCFFQKSVISGKNSIFCRISDGNTLHWNCNAGFLSWQDGMIREKRREGRGENGEKMKKS